jgi:hypothetical protein
MVGWTIVFWLDDLLWNVSTSKASVAHTFVCNDYDSSKISKEAATVMAYFKVPDQYWPGKREEIHENLSEQLSSGKNQD